VRVRPIHFVPDVERALCFYGALGLRPELRDRSGRWVELHASAGELALHHGPSADDGAGREGVLFTLVADEPLEAVAQRLHAAGFPPEGEPVDEPWGRSLFVRAPDGTLVQIDAQEPDLYT
jgi:catechol 2,3-dioxygenase-like lactoylglutathione lyase family enzyme